MSLADRASAIASRAKAKETEKPRELTEAETRELHAAFERSNPKREWFNVTRNGTTFDIAFNPPITLNEAKERYPDCTVREAKR
jgi:hypothetical protein